MPDRFDPYHRWLGIPAEKQPANHYFQTGQHGTLSQKLLNEVVFLSRLFG